MVSCVIAENAIRRGIFGAAASAESTYQVWKLSKPLPQYNGSVEFMMPMESCDRVRAILENWFNWIWWFGVCNAYTLAFRRRWANAALGRHCSKRRTIKIQWNSFSSFADTLDMECCNMRASLARAHTHRLRGPFALASAFVACRQTPTSCRRVPTGRLTFIFVWRDSTATGICIWKKKEKQKKNRKRVMRIDVLNGLGWRRANALHQKEWLIEVSRAHVFNNRPKQMPNSL